MHYMIETPSVLMEMVMFNIFYTIITATTYKELYAKGRDINFKNSIFFSQS